MFKSALDVANGQMIYRDTFSPYGVMTTLLQALVLKVFGNQLYIIQIETAFFYGLISICLWYIWRLILPKWLTTVSVLIWLFLAPYFVWTMLPWSSVPALLFQLLSLLIIFRALKDHNRLMIMLSGCIAVFVFWCRQPVGILHCASIMIFLYTSSIILDRTKKEAITDCTYFIAGIIVVSLPFLLWFTFNEALYDMYLQAIKAPFFGEIIMRNPGVGYNADKFFFEIGKSFLHVLQKLFPIHYGSGTSPMWSLIPIVCLYLFFNLIVKEYYNRGRLKNQLHLYGLLLVSLFSWGQYYPMNCIRHCYWAATPMIGLIPYTILQLSKRKKKHIQNYIICLVLVSIFGLDISYRIYYGIRRINNHSTRIEGPEVLRGMYSNSYMVKLYEKMSISLNNAIKNSPFPYLLTFSNDPLYLTFIGPQENYHPMYMDLNPLNQYIYPDFNLKRELFIKKNNPVILGFNDTPIPGAICVDSFNVSGFRQQSKLALYIFEDNKQHKLIGQNDILQEL